MTSTDPLEAKTDLERQILKAIADQLKSGTITVERSKEIAKIVLECLKPTHSLVEIHVQLPRLMQQISELKSVIEPLYQEFNQKVTGVVKDHLDQLLAQGEVEKAHNVIAKIIT